MNSHVCFVTQRYFPGDSRLTSQIPPLQDAGYKVDVICMRGPNQPAFSNDQANNIYRINSMTRKRASKLRYIAEYVSFFVPCLFLLALLQLRKRYCVVDVTNLPDPLVFSALIPKLMGAKVIFDVRECTPEMFNDRFGIRMNSKAMKLMIWLEQLSIKFADEVITCTEQMRQALIHRGAEPNKISVTINVGDSRIYKDPVLPDPTEQPEEFRIITHGTIIKRYGHETLVKAMPYILAKVPRARLEILGRGNLQPELETLVQKLDLSHAVTFAGFVPDNELIKRLRAAHCGVVPLLKNPESDLVHTHKMFEFIALGIPVVVSRTTAVQAYFDEKSLSFFESNDEQDLARAIVELHDDPQKRYQFAQNALEQFKQYSPAKQKATFVGIVDGLAINMVASTRHNIPER